MTTFNDLVDDCYKLIFQHVLATSKTYPNIFHQHYNGRMLMSLMSINKNSRRNIIQFIDYLINKYTKYPTTTYEDYILWLGSGNRVHYNEFYLRNSLTKYGYIGPVIRTPMLSSLNKLTQLVDLRLSNKFMFIRL